MFAALLPWIISGASTIGSALLQNAGNRANQDAMNQYNSPQAQMARYGAAGLNPNLIYGQGTPGNQPSAVPYTAPTVDPADLMGKHQAYWESRSRQGLHSQQADSIMWKRFYDNMLRDSQSRYYDSNARYSNRMMKERIMQVIRQGKNQVLQNANLKLDNAIKSNIERERSYYNQLRKYGIEKQDSPIFRMGYSIFRHMSARPAGSSMKAGKAYPKP